MDLTNGDGLDAALTHAVAVVETTNCTGTGRDEAVAYFGATTRNLLAAEQRAGVRHHVLLSIVGVDRVDLARRAAMVSPLPALSIWDRARMPSTAQP